MTCFATIGLGLIGASCCAGLRARTDWRIHGFARSEATRQEALARGLIDASFDTIEATVRDADLVLIAVPMGQFATVFAEVAAARGESAWVTDAGSTKGSVLVDIAACFGEVPSWFVPGHPIAGSERSGVEAANPDLYVNHQVILTPTAGTDPLAIHAVTSFCNSSAHRCRTWMQRGMTRCSHFDQSSTACVGF